MQDKALKNKLARYMDAGFPVLYINTFEESKVDEIIRQIAGGREVYEWNGSQGFIDAKTRTTVMGEDVALGSMLDEFREPGELDQKILVLKDIGSYLPLISCKMWK